MPDTRLSPEDSATASLLALHIGEIEENAPIDPVHWRMLKARLADSPTTEIAGVAAKLRVVLEGIQFEVDADDIRILKSAIDDLIVLSRPP